MRSTSRRRAATLAVLGLLAGLVPTLLGASPASAASVTTPNSCTNTAQAGTSALDITVNGEGLPNPITLGSGDVTLSGATFGIEVPPTVLLAGYGLGLLTTGLNSIPAEVNVTILGSNTSQGSQTVGPIAVTGTTTITDPTPADKTSGDESATPLSVSATIPTTTWTPTGGPVALSLGNSSTTALVGPGGIIAVTFSCTPGTPGPAGCGEPPLVDCTTTIPVPAAPFSTVTVVAPPTAPVCTNEAVNVGAGQSVSINLTDNCSDVNGDIDTTTFAVSAPSAGTLTGSGGTYTYQAPTTDPGGPVLLDFTVADSGGLTSNTAQVSITVLANSCEAGPSCSLTEVVEQEVIGAAMTLTKAPDAVLMSDVTLNGQPQVSTGDMKQLTVLNARGTSAPWSVTGFMTDLGAPGAPTWTLGDTTLYSCTVEGGTFGTASGNTDPHRLCIPGNNMGWAPDAAVAHDVIYGDVAAVDPGPSHAVDGADWLAQLIAAGQSGADGLGGLFDQNLLCNAPMDQSGGTFTCDAQLFLGVPASAGAGTYQGGLYLTLL